MRGADGFPDLRVAPARPETLDDVVLDAEFTGPSAELLDFLKRVAAAIKIFHVARPGLIQSVFMPLGNSFGSGGGQRL